MYGGEVAVGDRETFDVDDGRGGQLDGAVAYAGEHGAPAVEGYPVDNGGAEVDVTMAYVGVRARRLQQGR